MRIVDYQYIHGTERQGNCWVIPELNREKPAAPQFMELASFNRKLTCPTAFIYIDGATVAQGESGLGLGNGKFTPAIKSGSTYTAHQWCSVFENIEWLESMAVVSGTCASAIEGLALAERIFDARFSDIQEVILIGHERITEDTLRLFRELGIPVVCGDGFVYVRLEKCGYEVTDINWRWAYNVNPFQFTRDTLDQLIPSYRVGYVKLHGTGTASNEEAERGLAAVATPLRYKEEIGHTQGISALLETCMVLDDPKIRGRILCTANGLGGYYGSFTLTKPHARDD